MTVRTCKGETEAGRPCRRSPSRNSNFCLAHDPARRDEHAKASRLGGMARHAPETLGLKAEVRELMTAMRSGEVSAGVGSVLLQAIRLLRELEAEEKLDASVDGFIESIRSMRESGDVPDLSEPSGPAANEPRGGIPDMSEPEPPYGPNIPRMEDYGRSDGTLDAEACTHDGHAHEPTPLSQLTVSQRRKRFASGRRG